MSITLIPNLPASDAPPHSDSNVATRLPQLRALTSVRFFAALHVALFHLVQPVSRWGPLAGIMGSGYTAVSFFFLLSGFILTYSHSQNAAQVRCAPRDFWVARFARIYPVYLVSLLFAFCVHPLQLVSRDRFAGITLDALMLQSWYVPLPYYFNIPAWSLSVEAFFYLVFPFVFLRLRASSVRGAVGLFTACWLMSIAAPALLVWHHPGLSIHGAWIGDSHLLPTIVTRVPLFALPEFLAGIALGWLHLHFKPAQSAAFKWCLAGAAGLGIGWALSPHLAFVLLNNGLLLPFQAMLILGLAQPNIFSRMLSGNTLVLLGEGSYALYLFHYLIGEFTRRRFGFSTSFASAAVQIIIAIAVAVAMHLVVERPARRWIVGQWRTRHA